jgi:hypothetical protein
VTGVGAIQHAAHLLDQAAAATRAALDHRLPVVVRRAATFEQRGKQMVAAIEQAEEAVTLLRGSGERAGPIADALQGRIDYLHRVFDRRAFADARHSVSNQSLADAWELNRDRLRLVASLDPLDAGAARRSLEQRLEPQLAPMIEGSRPAMREVALIAGLPDDLRPRQLQTRFNASTWDAIEGSPRPDQSLAVADAQAEARAALDRFRIGRMSQEQLDEHVRRLLDRDPDSLTRADVRELALVVTTPGASHEALALPSLREQRRLGQLLLHERSLTDGIPNRMADDTFLREIEAAALVRSGAIRSRAQATAQLAELLARTDTPTGADARRISLLLRLPDSHRPPLPTTPEAWLLKNVGLWFGRHLRDREPAAIAAARAHFRDAMDPAAGLAELRRSMIGQTDFELHRLSALLADPDAVRAAGITSEMLDRFMMRHLGRAGSSEVRGRQLEQLLDHARESLTARTVQAELEPVRAEALELAERNLDRMRGLRTDTFGQHPDYAEVGRLAATLRLLDSLGSPAPRPAPADAAAQVLRW